jgi:hypothetical protein
MLVVFLSGSGGRVEIPNAVECVNGDSDDVVEFLDQQGSCLARFRRQDVSMFGSPDNIAAVDGLEASEPVT